MTTDEKRVARWGAVLGIIVALLSIAAIARREADARYVRRDEYREAFIRDSLWKQGVESQLDNMDGKLDQIYQCIRRAECR